ncbi:hypothetical protein GCM10007304_48890 [Rhodococcoides trifolii]|uniref:O-antigen ligase-related domain-containing protein n=1 Tax=Rhodococcoides trifolii TaxID=908250 RepID=A0A917G973_9NOCA|nr:O-antigen ligase family protein [Rhodococcus trifolii]GGG29250.1 hypothetical protein GCM10007304_48890 [Rhodococcus trifolii]
MTSTVTPPVDLAHRDTLDFSDRSIALLVGSAVAVVGVNRPAVAGLPPSVIMIAVAFAWTMVLRRTPGSPGSRFSTIDALLGAWLVAKVVVEYYNAGHLQVPLELGPLLDLVLAAMVVVILKRRFGTADRVVRFARCFLIPAVGVAVLALLQVLGLFGVNRRLASITSGSALEARIENGWDIRGTATIGHWTALGGYLCVCIAICCALLLRAHRRREPLRLLGVALAVLVAGQVTTFTFATIAVTAVTLLSVAVVVKPRPGQIIAPLAVGGVLWWAFSSAIDERIAKQLASDPGTASTLLPESVAFRLNIWTHETLPAISDSPLLGHGLGVYKYVGTGRVPYVLQWQSPESEWLRTAVSSGVVVLLLEVAVVLAAVRLLWRAARSVPGSYAIPLAVMLVAMVAAMCIHSHLADRGFLLSFWVVVTGVQIISTPTRSTPTRSTPTRRKQ